MTSDGKIGNDFSFLRKKILEFGYCRLWARTWIICPAMDTAISAGVSASISMPMVTDSAIPVTFEDLLPSGLPAGNLFLQGNIRGADANPFASGKVRKDLVLSMSISSMAILLSKKDFFLQT